MKKIFNLVAAAIMVFTMSNCSTKQMATTTTAPAVDTTAIIQVEANREFLSIAEALQMMQDPSVAERFCPNMAINSKRIMKSIVSINIRPCSIKTVHFLNKLVQVHISTCQKPRRKVHLAM